MRFKISVNERKLLFLLVTITMATKIVGWNWIYK